MSELVIVKKQGKTEKDVCLRLTKEDGHQHMVRYNHYAGNNQLKLSTLHQPSDAINIFCCIWRQHGPGRRTTVICSTLTILSGSSGGLAQNTPPPLLFKGINIALEFGISIALELNIHMAILTCTYGKSIHILHGYFSGQTRSMNALQI